MEIEDRYFKLLNLLIHDKRSGMNGMISGLVISQHFGELSIYYKAFMNRTYSNKSVFVEDIESGNIVFLLPFGVKYMEKEMEEMAQRHEKQIRDFFGDKFRGDMIIRISEDDRQEEIRKWESLTIGLENWDNLIDTNGWTNADKELPDQGKPVLCAVEYNMDTKTHKRFEMLRYGGSFKWLGLGRENDVVKWWRYPPELPNGGVFYENG